jgi:hypothetical protein
VREQVAPSKDSMRRTVPLLPADEDARGPQLPAGDHALTQAVARGQPQLNEHHGQVVVDNNQIVRR